MSEDLQLSDLQLAIMRVLWDRGEASASEVQADLAEGGRDLAPTTVSTLLSRLARRGLVDARRSGRHFSYVAQVSEEEIRSSMVSRVTEHLFAGDALALMSHLLRDSDLGPDGLAEVRRLLAAVEEPAAKKKEST
ncbi:MAG: BlaI/MecI/CopY family transcriptional regulator [Nannocystaceae bacterium]